MFPVPENFHSQLLTKTLEKIKKGTEGGRGGGGEGKKKKRKK